MKTPLVLIGAIVGALLAPAMSFGEETDKDREHPKAYVMDSAITAKIKTKLAAEHLSSLAKIHVDTDANGVVWLSGTARSQGDMDKAVSIARATENVRDVRNQLTIKKDD